MKIEQHDEFTVIDKRGDAGGELCRVCGCTEDCHTTSYGKPTMECIKWLRSEIKRLETIYA